MLIEIAVLSFFASSVFSILVNKLANSTFNIIGDIISKDVQDDLEELGTKACSVQEKLNKINELGDKDLQEITDLCYLADDIIDGINIKIMKHHQQNGSVGSSVNDNNVMCGSGIISELLGRLFSWGSWGQATASVDILRQQISLVEQAFDNRRHTTNTSRSRIRRGYLDPSGIHLPAGRMREKQSIIDQLLELKESEGGRGISIVGQAGLGKTVLASTILNDNIIRRQFKVISWASLKNDHWNSDQDILIETIPSVNEDTSQQASSSSGCDCRSINLLVLDDIPIKKHEDWKYLKAKYMQPEPTLVIITSRDPEVAKFTGTTLHYLQPLSIEDCEEVIDNNVSRVLFDHNLLVFKSKVKRIAKKCDGLPLVADAIGVSLEAECKSNPELFQTVISLYEDKELWEQDIFLKEILPNLGFDETSLPKELCKFLAYFSLFPPEHYFDKGELSQLWMAEGFINVAPQWTLKPATDHFNGLVSTSVLQRAKSCPKGRAVSSSTYQMHSYAHKFAQILARTTYFRLDEGAHSDIKDKDKGILSSLPKSNICHFSSYCQVVDSVVLNHIKDNFSRLRTFLVLSKNKTYGTAIKPIPHSMFRKLKYLRVLSLSNSSITEIPSTISKLKHLRYLDVSNTSIQRLPKGVCNLICLQVLKLKSCPLSILPDNFASLINLTHLELDMLKLNPTPANLGKLTSLQTLPVFIVKTEEGRSITELGNLNKLKESIKITGLENVASNKDAVEANLHLKREIKTLFLEWTEKPKQDSYVAEEILTGLKPSDKVIELIVSNYTGIKFPRWVNMLHNVSRIYLYNFPNCNKFPPLGSLRLLKSLTIQLMPKITEINHHRSEEIQYPALESLIILYMDNLVKWGSYSSEHMPRLGELRANSCPELVSLPMICKLRSSTKLQILNCPKLPARDD